MSEPTPSENERRLSDLLREWRIEAPLPFGFNAGVQHRISAANESAISSFFKYLLRRLDLWFARPELAISYVALLLVAGLAAGSWHAERESARIEQALAMQYVRSVDPYQTPRH